MQTIKEDLQQNQQLQAVIRKVKFRLLPLMVLITRIDVCSSEITKDMRSH